MTRKLGLLAMLLAGCSPPPDSADPDLDFADWPTATAEPYRVDPALIVYCRPPTPVKAPDGASLVHRGPHDWPAIIVRVSPTAMSDFRAGRPLPVGAVVVKEKHPAAVQSAPSEYATMVKREAGYDPANGDWEYRYVVRGPEPSSTQGRLQNCIDCHRHAAATDHLFRTYLKPDRP